MKYISLFLIFALHSCVAQSGQSEKKLIDAPEFSKAISDVENPQLIDVRTPQEFEQGHIKNAVNYNWRGSDFNNEIQQLDKSKPVFVYCQSGGRSAEAAAKLIQEGFEVVELKGGMLNWRSHELPEQSAATSQNGMSSTEFQNLLQSDTLILIDFYADWCAPCVKMKPYFESISNDLKDQVKVLRIDVEANKDLAQQLKINALPYIALFKDHKLVWDHYGYMSENELREKLK